MHRALWDYRDEQSFQLFSQETLLIEGDVGLSSGLSKHFLFLPTSNSSLDLKLSEGRDNAFNLLLTP